MSGDIVLLEQLTSDQRLLCVRIRQMMDPPGEGNCASIRESRVNSEMLRAQERVLHLGRVQCALLLRAQQRLHAISNLMIGADCFYKPAVNKETVDLHRLVSRGA